MLSLIHGDCIKKLKDISDNSIDIIISDLPYGIFEKKHPQRNIKWDNKLNLKDLWKELWRVSKNTTPIFLFADFKFAVELINSQPKYFKYEIVWCKNQTTTPMLSYKRFGKSTEYILVFYKKQPIYNYQKYHKLTQKIRPLSGGGVGHQPEQKNYKAKRWTPSLPVNVIKCGNVNRKKDKIIGITQKPVEIIEHILKYFSNENDVCLDPCMGSGSTGEACKNLNRGFIGVEINKKHFDYATKRLGEGKEAILEI